MMKFKYISTFCFFLVFLIAKSQQNQSIINVIPPSPESTFKTDFGNIPINEYRGIPSLTIPIYSFTKGKINHSIDLSYSKLGVKVNDITDITGVSWILNVGGVINRTIYDLPDENGERFLINDINSLNIPTIQEGTPQAEFISTKVKNENIDNEVDIFNFTVNNYSGSFYLDTNFQPILLEDGKGVKIQTIGNFAITHEFILTAPDGIQYYFGGNNFVDTTFIKNNPILGGITSFYLYKIVENNNIVEYTYYTANSKSVALSAFESQSYSFESSFPGGYTPNNTCSVPPPSSNSSSISTLNIQNPKKIKKILFNDQEIAFNYENVNGQPYEKLINIQIYKSQVLERQINFIYLDKVENSYNQRFFLEKVQFFSVYNNQQNLINEFSLEYDNPLEIPERLSKSVDVLGYFNGKYGNTTLVPNLFLLGGNYNNNSLADRRADFDFAKKGTLKSITYPTKGKTVFEYESHVLKEAVHASVLGTVTSGSTAISDYKIINGSELYVKSNDLTNICPLNISISLFMASPTAVPSLQGKIRFKIINNDNNQDILVKDLFLAKNMGSLTHNLIFSANKNINYKFSIEILGNYQGFTSDFEIFFQTGIQKKEGIGLRLKKQYDMNETGAISNIKRIYYTGIQDYNNLELLSENPYVSGAFTTAKYTQFVADQNGPSGSSGCFANGDSFFNYEKLIISDPIAADDSEFVPSYNVNSSPTVSISYGGDHFEKGGEEKTFLFENESSLMTIRDPYDGLPYYVGKPGELPAVTQNIIQKIQRKKIYNHYNGTLSNVLIFEKGPNDYLFLKQKTQNIYERTEGSSIYNLLGTEIYHATAYPSGTVPGSALFNMWFGFTKISTFFNHLQEVKTTEYLESVPAYVTDDSNYKKLVTISNFQYDNLPKQLTRQTVKFSDTSVQETSYKYAHEKNNSYLISKNMIGIPLETTVIKRKDSLDIGKIISKAETIYPVSQSEADTKTSGLALPYEVKLTDFSGVAATEVTYDKYDLKGNLLQYTGKNGIPTAIIWGYNGTQPIAKITGATYSQVSSLAAAIVTSSDTDATAAANNDETSFLLALDSFRKDSRLAGYQITTYTYDPLIGVRSITPPSGIREVYLYDNANRLKEIREDNATGKILKEFKYNYKH